MYRDFTAAYNEGRLKTLVPTMETKDGFQTASYIDRQTFYFFFACFNESMATAKTIIEPFMMYCQ